MSAITYALYRGDEFLDVGTALELSKRFHVDPETIRWYSTPVHHRRCEGRENRLLAIRVNDMEEELVQVSIQSNGVYFAYRLPDVKRGIKGKTRAQVDELLIVGVPTKGVQDYCLREHLIITNKAVYQNDLDNPILFRNGESFVYVEKEKLTNA